jgi:hypothetical protein
LTIEWPVLWVDTDDDLPQIGAPSLEWQGKPLDIPTIDEWTLQMGRGRFATLTVQVPVIVPTRTATFTHLLPDPLRARAAPRLPQKSPAIFSRVFSGSRDYPDLDPRSAAIGRG